MATNEEPKIGLLYRHFKGGVYVIRAFSHDEKTDEVCVVYSDVLTGKVYHRPLASFFDEHPKLKVPRFVRVAPSKTN